MLVKVLHAILYVCYFIQFLCVVGLIMELFSRAAP